MILRHASGPLQGFGHHSLGVRSEISTKHPLQVVGIVPSYDIKRLTSVLPEAKTDLALNPNEPLAKTHGLRIHELFVQVVHYAGEVFVTIEHRGQDFRRSLHI